MAQEQQEQRITRLEAEVAALRDLMAHLLRPTRRSGLAAGRRVQGSGQLVEAGDQMFRTLHQLEDLRGKID